MFLLKKQPTSNNTGPKSSLQEQEDVVVKYMQTVKTSGKSAFPRRGFTAIPCAKQQQILIVAGMKNNIALKDICALSLSTNSYQCPLDGVNSDTVQLTPRVFHSATLCNGKIYIYGGLLGSSASSNNPSKTVKKHDDSLFCFHVDEKRWSRIEVPSSFIPPARHGHAAALGRNSHLYIHGGQTDGDRYLSDFVLLNLNNFRFECVPVPSGLAGRAYHSLDSFADGAKLVLFGGECGYDCMDDIWIYDTGSNSWRDCSPRDANKPCARYQHATVIYGKHLLVFGGKDFTGTPLKDVWAFDLEVLRWIRLGSMPAARSDFTACLVKDSIHLIGGHDARDMDYHSFYTLNASKLKSALKKTAAGADLLSYSQPPSTKVPHYIDPNTVTLVAPPPPTKREDSFFADDAPSVVLAAGKPDDGSTMESTLLLNDLMAQSPPPPVDLPPVPLDMPLSPPPLPPPSMMFQKDDSLKRDLEDALQIVSSQAGQLKDNSTQISQLQEQVETLKKELSQTKTRYDLIVAERTDTDKSLSQAEKQFTEQMLQKDKMILEFKTQLEALIVSERSWIEKTEAHEQRLAEERKLERQQADSLIVDLKQQTASKDEELAKLHAEFNEYRERVSKDTTSSSKEKRATIADLRKQVDEFTKKEKARQSELAQLEKTLNAKHDKELALKVKDITDLTKALSSEKESVQRLTTELASKTVNLETLAGNLKDTIATVKAMQACVNEKDIAIAGLKQRLDATSSEESSVVASYQSKISQLKDLVKKYEMEISHIGTRCEATASELRSTHDRHRNELNEKDSTIASLEEKLKSSTLSESALLAEYQNEIKQLNELIQKYEIKIGDFETQLSDNADRYTDLQSQNSRLQEQVDYFKETINSGKLEENEEQFEEKMKNLEQLLKESNEKFITQQSKISEQENQIATLIAARTSSMSSIPAPTPPPNVSSKRANVPPPPPPPAPISTGAVPPPPPMPPASSTPSAVNIPPPPPPPGPANQPTSPALPQRLNLLAEIQRGKQLKSVAQQQSTAEAQPAKPAKADPMAAMLAEMQKKKLKSTANVVRVGK